jgi:hypothetical protein
MEWSIMHLFLRETPACTGKGLEHLHSSGFTEVVRETCVLYYPPLAPEHLDPQNIRYVGQRPWHLDRIRWAKAYGGALQCNILGPIFRVAHSMEALRASGDPMPCVSYAVFCCQCIQ